MKRVLLDQNVPRKLVRHLAPHLVDTAFARGWAALTNGDLIAAAEAAGFEVLITADQNLAYQQNLAQRRLAIVVIDTNRWPRLASSTNLVLSAIDTSTAGSFQVVRCF